jgi:hypothetical protein
MNAQARGKAVVTNPACDCKFENGKNTIVFGGALTYKGNKFTAPSTNRFQFGPQF